MMSKSFTTFVCGVMLLIVMPFAPSIAKSADTSPQVQILEGLGITQRLGEQLPSDLVVRDESNKPVHLRDLQRRKPIILTLVYYNCPMLCTLVLNDLMSTAKVIPQTAGNQYDIWTISFDPNETAALAAQKKAGYLHSYELTKGAIDPNGWRFLTADAANIRSLTTAVGFRYRWDEPSKQYIHPAGIMILTPDEHIARYFFGIDFDPTDIRLSLVEASHGKIATVTDQILLFCYHYDPATGKYGLAITNALRAGAALTILALGTLLYWLWRHDQRRTRRLLSIAAQNQSGMADIHRQGASP